MSARISVCCHVKIELVGCLEQLICIIKKSQNLVLQKFQRFAKNLCPQIFPAICYVSAAGSVDMWFLRDRLHRVMCADRSRAGPSGSGKTKQASL